ncbi:hypothetical protein [Fulvivirga imtechensis]|uniref:hypothetical protein n=1 Tax=Fulvivirga imtechensis TaxID=881893 RepID=UPI0012FC256C|nr:hypothetical protein [Fulvivirga imtechensis]
MRTSVTKISFILLCLAFTLSSFGQTISSFTYSRCLEEHFNDSSRVIKIDQLKGLTEIQLRTYGPCNGNFDAGVELKGRVLNLKFWTKPTTLTDEDGNEVELLEVAECNCIFLFDYQIDELAIQEFDSIKVNGETLEQIDAENILTEMLEIKLDTLKE